MNPHFDTIVVGGGTAGPVVAGRLVERGQRVLLIEAGPDYGPADSGRWPADLLDGTASARSHDWGYTDSGPTGRPNHTLSRARVMGGCSSHNGCIAILGHRLDYDGWAGAGNPGWAANEMLDIFAEVKRRMRVRQYRPEEINPFHQAFIEATGLPRIADHNDLEDVIGVAPAPINITEAGVRWNAAFAYLDPVRHSPNLKVMDQTLVDRVLLEGGRAVGVVALGPDGPLTLHSERVVLCAGAYGTPAILLRSGVGPAEDLKALGIPVSCDLPGVGHNLHDHASADLTYSGTPEGVAALEGFVRSGRVWFSEQAIAKLPSAHCQQAFDLHLYPIFKAAGSSLEVTIPVGLMAPQSRGRLRLRDPNPASAPIIQTNYLSDPEGHDLKALWDGIAFARRIARQPALAALIGEESGPSLGYQTPADVLRDVQHYYHPVGTCKMGPSNDAGAVADASGKVYGLDGLYLADASLIPTVPRANTNLPVLVVAERVVGGLRT